MIFSGFFWLKSTQYISVTLIIQKADKEIKETNVLQLFQQDIHQQYYFLHNLVSFSKEEYDDGNTFVSGWAWLKYLESFFKLASWFQNVKALILHKWVAFNNIFILLIKQISWSNSKIHFLWWFLIVSESYIRIISEI